MLIKGGMVVDGTGSPAVAANVAISAEVIAAVGPAIEGPAAEVIDATGCVAPGVVDMHTRYDGQVLWDDRVLLSSAHGVTSVAHVDVGALTQSDRTAVVQAV